MDQTRHSEIEGLIARTALGDRAAFDELYHSTSAKLHAVCLSILKNRPEAEETLQEVYIRVWKSADRYAANGWSPMTWLITIARNRSIDKLRARQGRPQAAPVEAADTVASSAPGPEAMALQAERYKILNECLSRLEQTQADAVRAVYLEGAGYADVAQREGAPLNTVRSWLRRSLLKLKDCVGA